MPYVKRKRNYRKSSRSTKTIVKKAVEQALKKTVEIKTDEASHVLASPTALVPLRYSDYFEIPEGDGSTQRVGQQVYMKSIRLRTTLFVSTAYDTARIIYVFIKNDKMNDALVAAFEGMSYNSFLPRNLAQSYKILADNTYNIDGDSFNTKDIKKTFKVDSKVIFTPAAETIRQGQLNCFVYSRNDTIQHSDSYRIYYTDN